MAGKKKSSGSSKKKLHPALKSGPKNLSKLPKGLQDYWRKKRANSK